MNTETQPTTPPKAAYTEQPTTPPKEKNPFYTFHGLELHRFAIAGGDVRLLGRRNRGQMPHQIWEIKIHRQANGAGFRVANISCNDTTLVTLATSARLGTLEKMAISALHRLLQERSRTSSRRRRAAKSAKESEVK